MITPSRLVTVYVTMSLITVMHGLPGRDVALAVCGQTLILTWNPAAIGTGNIDKGACNNKQMRNAAGLHIAGIFAGQQAEQQCSSNCLLGASTNVTYTITGCTKNGGPGGTLDRLQVSITRVDVTCPAKPPEHEPLPTRAATARLRPTRTPITAARPTRTPKTVARPTRTPITVERSTRTPITVRPTRTLIPIMRPTRTLVAIEPPPTTATPRPTRTPTPRP